MYQDREVFYDILYQYSHFFLAVYAIFLLFFAILLFIFGVFSSMFFSFEGLFLIILALLLVPYGLDVFSRSIYNYPFFHMLLRPKNHLKWNKIIEFLYKYVRFCYVFNAFFFVLFCVFCMLAWLHFMLFFTMDLCFNFYAMSSILLVFCSPIVCEIFYYGWENKSLYFVAKVLKKSSKDKVFL